MTNSTDKAFNESVSAMLDDEGQEIDARRVLKQMEQSESGRDVWRRYHLAQAAIRGEVYSENKIDLSATIRDAIDAEETVFAEPAATGASAGNRERRWTAILGKTAIAASVALVSVIGLQQFAGGPTPVAPAGGGNTLAEQSGETRPQVNAAAGVPEGFELPPLATRRVAGGNLGNYQPTQQSPNYARNPVGNVTISPQTEADPRLQEYLNRLMLQHAENSARAGAIGVTPYVRVSSPGESPE